MKIDKSLIDIAVARFQYELDMLIDSNPIAYEALIELGKRQFISMIDTATFLHHDVPTSYLELYLSLRNELK